MIAHLPPLVRQYVDIPLCEFEFADVSPEEVRRRELKRWHNKLSQLEKKRIKRQRWERQHVRKRGEQNEAM